MIRVPEQPVVVGRLVLRRVIDVDVEDMRRQFFELRPPAHVAAAEELLDEARNRIVLVVVVRDDRMIALVLQALVIAVDLAKVAPAVLVDDLALPLEGAFALDRLIDEREVPGAGTVIDSREVWDRSRGAIPAGIRMRDEPVATPRERLFGRRVRPERHPQLVGLLLAALNFVNVRVLSREKAYRDFGAVRRDLLREVLPEVRHRDGERSV